MCGHGWPARRYSCDFITKTIQIEQFKERVNNLGPTHVWDLSIDVTRFQPA